RPDGGSTHTAVTQGTISTRKALSAFHDTTLSGINSDQRSCPDPRGFPSPHGVPAGPHAISAHRRSRHFPVLRERICETCACRSRRFVVFLFPESIRRLPASLENDAVSVRRYGFRGHSAGAKHGRVSGPGLDCSALCA